MTFIEAFLITLAVFAVIGGVVTVVALIQVRNELTNGGAQNAEINKSITFYRNKRGW